MLRVAAGGRGEGIEMVVGVPRSPNDAVGAAFGQLRDRYVRSILEAFPGVSTYLGGDGWRADLVAANGRLRSYEPGALRAELAAYGSYEDELASIDPMALDVADRIDHEVIGAQIAFLKHQIADLRYHERSVDTYVGEPQRGIERQVRQISDAPDGEAGSDAAWNRVVERLRAIPRYLEVARSNLAAGLASGNVPDGRLVQRDGIDNSRSIEAYFRSELPATATELLGARRSAPRLVATLAECATRAADEYRAFGAFFAAQPWPREDRYSIGVDEYGWRVRNNLRDARSVDELWSYGIRQVELYRERVIEAAAQISRRDGLGLSFGAGEANASTRAVIDHVGRETPRDDDELLRWWVDTGRRAVEYGRRVGLFDLPAEYRLDVLPTTPLRRSAIDAEYETAPPLHRGGVGRLFVTPTDNDPARLALHSRASITDMAVHEGFPGHDWHFRFMAERGDAISPVRWLTPGAIDDSAAMWTDSMAVEGWALYAEELMAGDTPGSTGFYDDAEYLFELLGQLTRAVRVRVDVGLHTGRLGFDAAVDDVLAQQEFAPEARDQSARDPQSRALLEGAERSVYRYSKWPTQAITYNLGKHAIEDLRDAERAAQGGAFDLRRFHEQLMGLGPIPPGYVRRPPVEGAAGSSRPRT